MPKNKVNLPVFVYSNSHLSLKHQNNIFYNIICNKHWFEGMHIIFLSLVKHWLINLHRPVNVIVRHTSGVL